jgi:hypothetical protein
MRQFRVEDGLIIEYRPGGKLLWKPIGHWSFPPPRLKRLWRKPLCRLKGHEWGGPNSLPGGWRVETEEWFEYVAGPEAWAWRGCRCGASEHVIAGYGA